MKGAGENPLATGHKQIKARSCVARIRPLRPCPGPPSIRIPQDLSRPVHYRFQVTTSRRNCRGLTESRYGMDSVSNVRSGGNYASVRFEPDAFCVTAAWLPALPASTATIATHSRYIYLNQFLKIVILHWERKALSSVQFGSALFCSEKYFGM